MDNKYENLLDNCHALAQFLSDLASAQTGEASEATRAAALVLTWMLQRVEDAE